MHEFFTRWASGGPLLERDLTGSVNESAVRAKGGRTAVWAWAHPVKLAPVWNITVVAEDAIPSKWLAAPRVIPPLTHQKMLALRAPPARRWELIISVGRSQLNKMLLQR